MKAAGWIRCVDCVLEWLLICSFGFSAKQKQAWNPYKLIRPIKTKREGLFFLLDNSTWLLIITAWTIYRNVMLSCYWFVETAVLKLRAKRFFRAQPQLVVPSVKGCASLNLCVYLTFSWLHLKAILLIFVTYHSFTVQLSQLCLALFSLNWGQFQYPAALVFFFSPQQLFSWCFTFVSFSLHYMFLLKTTCSHRHFADWEMNV